jgi:hypothetical protein
MNYILIDNDKLIRLAWLSKAKKANENLKAYSSVDEFQSDLHEICLSSQIYIDSDLGNDIKGEIVAKSFFQKGFKNIYLTTGYKDLDISCYSWLKAIVSKRPPF